VLSGPNTQCADAATRYRRDAAFRDRDTHAIARGPSPMSTTLRRMHLSRTWVNRAPSGTPYAIFLMDREVQDPLVWVHKDPCKLPSARRCHDR
jgi:hypothetical protein